MVILTHFDRNNTLLRNSITNVGRNPVAELYYGGTTTDKTYSRFIFQFDEEKLKTLYTGGTFTDLTKLTHTLKMTNTGSFDKELMGDKTCDGKDRACSFDLILFPVTQDWDEGNGYDYDECNIIGDTSTDTCPSNWFESQTNISWNINEGVYSGTPTTVLGTQHFEQGNENVEIDITDVVNGYLTGGTNYGMGLAFPQSLEETVTNSKQYVGFFTRHTQTYFEPYVESVYDSPIRDDRNSFYKGKTNTLYLYANVGGQPTNLDNIPNVTIYDQDDIVYSAITSSGVTHVTKGIYSVDVAVPTSSDGCVFYSDVWSNINTNGSARGNVTLDFEVKDDEEYFDFGTNEYKVLDYGMTVTGFKRDEKVKRGDVRKVYVNVRKPFTIKETDVIDGLEYRLFIKEGTAEVNVIDWQDVNRSYTNNYFLLDTAWMIPNTYYIDVKLTSNQEVKTYSSILRFEVVNQK